MDLKKRTYERYCRFIRLQFKGAFANEAARVVGMSAGAGHRLMCRIRKRAFAWADQPISDVLIIRLMCDRQRAEADLRELQANGLFRAE